MVEVFVGQQGTAVVRMLDADGRETNTYDVISGVAYQSSDADVVSVIDDDAEPRDARLQAHAVSTSPVVITCTFDGDPGSGVREIVLQSEEITVVEPPPGEAVSGEFSVEFSPAP